MKYAVVGFRVVEDLPRLDRELLALAELRRDEVSQKEEVEELRRFRAGEIPFSACQHVPAHLRVFEDPKFYDIPVRADNPRKPASVKVPQRNNVPFEAEYVVEDKPPRLGWGWLDAWGDRQPACC